ncbi:hypothetical protein Tco_0077630 [Tanacetum coccineum]
MGGRSPTFGLGKGVNVEKPSGGVPSHSFVMPEKKALVERENVGFDLTKSDLCPSFAEYHTAKGVGLRVANSHTSNHREDDFKPQETIRRFLDVFESRSLSSLNGGLRAGEEGTPSV